MAFGLALLSFYIFKTNQAVVLRYQIGVAKPMLAKENIITQNFLATQEDYLNKLKEAATTRGMIVVERFDSFFRESGVALKQSR